MGLLLSGRRCCTRPGPTVQRTGPVFTPTGQCVQLATQVLVIKVKFVTLMDSTPGISWELPDKTRHGDRQGDMDKWYLDEHVNQRGKMGFSSFGDLRGQWRSSRKPNTSLNGYHGITCSFLSGMQLFSRLEL